MSPLPKKAESPQVIPSHPLASMFPLLDGAEFKDLAADIKKNGLREKIAKYQGQVLDGRNRYRACLNAKIEPQFEEFQGDDAAAAAFVISKNIRRRHLTAKQRRELIAKLLKAQPGTSDRHIADMTNSSPTTVGAVRRETGSTVQSGQLPLKRVGKDGKARRQPTKEAKPAHSTKADKPSTKVTPPSPPVSHASHRSGTQDLEEQIVEDRKYARALVKQDREGALWLRAILGNEKRRWAVAEALATALKNTAGNAEDAATGNTAGKAEARKKMYATTESGDKTPAAPEITRELAAAVTQVTHDSKAASPASSTSKRA